MPHPSRCPCLARSVQNHRSPFAVSMRLFAYKTAPRTPRHADRHLDAHGRGRGEKGQVLDGTGASGLAMHVKSDAMWVGTKSERPNEMVATEGEVTRLRLILQGERVFESGNGARFTPSAEVGLRHDGGDAETVTGLEVGAGLRYSAGALTIEGQVRALVAHEASGYEEWGASGAIRMTPSASGGDSRCRSPRCGARPGARPSGSGRRAMRARSGAKTSSRRAGGSRWTRATDSASPATAACSRPTQV